MEDATRSTVDIQTPIKPAEVPNSPEDTIPVATPSLLAAPGGPIGGIIVKGGKNPGGQMLVIATTDSDGKFTIDFAEGGEYKLTFEQGQDKQDFSDRVKAGVQLDYSIKTPASANRHTPFHNKIEGSEIIITVPAGGGTVSGVLSSTELTQRSINESGVSVRSEPKKGGIKK